MGDGPGVITYNIGKEEVGIADISVRDWPLKDSSEFEVPLPGLGKTQHRKVSPQVDEKGNGIIVSYNDPSLYFPKPYSKIATAFLTGDYSASFLPFTQCERSWEIVTGGSPAVCLDPKPEDVKVLSELHLHLHQLRRLV